MQDPDLKCRHFVISWHFMAFWHVCQKANCITKSAFSAFSRLSDFSALAVSLSYISLYHSTPSFLSLPNFSNYTCNFSTHSPLASGSWRSSGVGEAVNQDILDYLNSCQYFDCSDYIGFSFPHQHNSRASHPGCDRLEFFAAEY